MTVTYKDVNYIRNIGQPFNLFKYEFYLNIKDYLKIQQFYLRNYIAFLLSLVTGGGDDNSLL
jgi:hypothetical protein